METDPVICLRGHGMSSREGPKGARVRTASAGADGGVGEAGGDVGRIYGFAAAFDELQTGVTDYRAWHAKGRRAASGDLVGIIGAVDLTAFGKSRIMSDTLTGKNCGKIFAFPAKFFSGGPFRRSVVL